MLEGEEPPELVLAGGPFDFTGLSRVKVPENCEQKYLNAWAYPAAGYEDYEDMYFAIFSENEEATPEEIHDKMVEILLPCENQLRELLGMDLTEKLTVELGVDLTPPPGQEEDGDTTEPDITPGQGSSDQANQNQTTQDQTTPDQTGEDKKPEETEGETTDRQDPPKPETAQPDGPETSQPSGPEPAETPGSTTETEEAAS